MVEQNQQQKKELQQARQQLICATFMQAEIFTNSS